MRHRTRGVLDTPRHDDEPGVQTSDRVYSWDLPLHRGSAGGVKSTAAEARDALAAVLLESPPGVCGTIRSATPALLLGATRYRYGPVLARGSVDQETCEVEWLLEDGWSW